MKIICIGRNYSDHAKELGNSVPKKPLFFLKPDSAILPKKQAFFYPEFTKDIHYELELVIKINRLGKHIEERFAKDYYKELSIGLDLTARDLQQECKEKGLPWERAKAFDHSAVFSEFVKVEGNTADLRLALHINGELRQSGGYELMLNKPESLIKEVSSFMTWVDGDVLMTGTPKGVGKVNKGDLFEAKVLSENRVLLECSWTVIRLN